MGSSGNYTQANRLLTLTTPLGEDVLLLSHVSGVEIMSRMFKFSLDLLSKQPTISFTKIVGQKVTIALQLADGTALRHFNGYVSRFAQTGTDSIFTHYQMEVVPWLWFLTRNANCRIFQNLTIPQIIEQIFQDRGFGSAYKTSFKTQYQPREYCVQYRETDFDFVSRLMEQYGISYFFEHSENDHTLVMTDNASAFQKCPVQSTVRYAPNVGQNVEDVVNGWQITQDLRTGKYTLGDYNFETPSANMTGFENTVDEIGGNTKYELYDYPGIYKTQSEGNTMARLRMQAEETIHLVANGTSTCRTLASGYLFDFDEHDRGDNNKEYLITEVHHVASAAGTYATSGADAHYSNQFVCMDSAIPYRPARITPKAFVQGPQTAVVVGPSGQEIYVDKYGRVKVQFFWDRLGKKNENSSCWIRVSQLWAGQGWGAMFIPRIGQEVIVSFLEGDPDRPIITGRVYNAEQTVPYDLPAHDTVSTIQSRSSPNGAAANFNEIRFEDKKGSEQIFVNAEKDMDQRVEHDSREYVGNDRHLIVNANQLEQVNKDKSLTIQGNHTEQIGNNSSLKIASNSVESIGSNFDLTIGSNRTESVGSNDARTVGSNLTETIGGNASLTVASKQTEMIGSDFSRTVGSNVSETVGQNVSQLIGQNFHQEAGQNINATAGMAINLMGGMSVKITGGAEGVSIVGPGGFISITEAGVAIMGTLVLINSGGSPSPASPASPQAPSSPESPASPQEPEAPTAPHTADDQSKFDKLS